MRMIKRLSTLFFMLFLGAFMLAPIGVGAQFDPLDKTCNPQENPQAANSTICMENSSSDGQDPVTGEDGILMNVIDILSIAVAVISVIIIIVAGMTMTLSGGDSGKVQSSRDAIIYAVVGIVVVVLSRAVVIFVVNTV